LITPTSPQSNPEEFMGVTRIEIAAFWEGIFLFTAADIIGHFFLMT